MSFSQETCLPDPAEIDSEGSSCEERESRRRLLGDSEGLPKKRRKQSTPVKFSTSLSMDDCDESEEESAGEIQGANNHDQREYNQQCELEGKPTASPDSKSTQGHPTNKDVNLNNEFRCEYCSQFFDSRVTLDVHLESEHNFNFSSNNVALHQHQHQQHQHQQHQHQQHQHQQHQQHQQQHQQQHNSQQQQQQHNQGLSNNNDSPLMQTQSRSSPETIDHAEQSISPINLSGISIRNFATSASWLSGQGQIQTQTDSPLAKIAVRNNNHFQTMPTGFPGPLAQFLPMPGFPLPDSTQIQRAAMGQFPKIFNPDAYCDLCNKEFCNKYFLKTHKANKHGIYVDTTPNSQSQGSDGAPSNTFVSTSSPGVNSLPTNMCIKVADQQSPRIDNNAMQQQPAIPCDICPKRFKSDDSLRKHKQKIHTNQGNDSIDSTQPPMTRPSSSEEERHSPVGMEALFKQEYCVDQEEAAYGLASKLVVGPASPQIKESPFNGEHCHRLVGVMNPEAFCEMCCKEYCNKYFLRTHKLKRHGILITDSDKSPSSSNPGITWHQIQTSPLNLIMTDSLGNGSESGDRTEEYACRSCGIRFQTLGLYHLHVEKIHDNGGHSSPRADHEADLTDQRADSISEDLQKLQTMILQLNGLESNKAASCALCGKDYDTPAALRNHMVAEHGVIPENLTSGEPQRVPSEKSSPTTTVAQVLCTLCEREFCNQEALRKHIAEDHQPLTPTSSTPQLPSSVTSTPKSNSSQQMERKAIASITPTSSYCEICNKELCNKYFMKTHMQKMHGIEIENGAQIGGVICNICKKELCSKYFLRVHKQNTHGIVEEGAGLGDLSLRYITHFTEVCPICNRRFRSSKWLKVHLQGEHGKAGIEKWREIEQYQQASPKTPARVPNIPKSGQHQHHLRIPNGFEPAQQLRTDLASLGNQVLSNFFGNTSDDQPAQNYRCSQLHCNFSTSILPLFFLHERSHSNHQHHNEESASLDSERTIQCPICNHVFGQPEMLRQHIISRHPSPFPGLLSQFPIPLLNDFNLSNDQPPRYHERGDYGDAKEDLRQPTPPHIMNEIDTNKMKKQEENNAVQVMPQGAYKCAQCGFATANLNRIKKHIRKDHKSLGDPAETVLTELTKTLKDVANKHKVPASYAMPQDINLTPDKTIMQPFIIEEIESPHNGGGPVCNNKDSLNSASRRFAPALVFLPVKTRVNGALTMSFTLNPA
ncbi:PREDICTED: uncharacterized protein LOC105365531 [Ceratosolen solmsi marchali]|uniref:Uncharacterized protein LOC105365531 n=1 Tax=Ceratosolen solmsi marchali TaxID=326594 RepID=A0AAJ6YPX3_9HYME|nr:PREDICTED: uncharacterized protein LOC105365531 [Ceratosolen solmsi marchali]